MRRASGHKGERKAFYPRLEASKTAAARAAKPAPIQRRPTLALISHTPFVLPSLGPTAILFFFHPMSASASPRHTLYGHAGAATLIVSLGIITWPWHLVVIEIAVAMLCLQAICFNRLVGLNYPLGWAGG